MLTEESEKRLMRSVVNTCPKEKDTSSKEQNCIERQISIESYIEYVFAEVPRSEKNPLTRSSEPR